MPWPQNSRTTLKPFFSACVWIAWPMSPIVAPGRTCWMPSHMHSYVTSDSRRAPIDGSPTKNIRLVSPW